MVVKIQVEVLQVVMLCVVVGYERFGRPCCLHLHGEARFFEMFVYYHSTTWHHNPDLD